MTRVTGRRLRGNGLAVSHRDTSGRPPHGGHGSIHREQASRQPSPPSLVPRQGLPRVVRDFPGSSGPGQGASLKTGREVTRGEKNPRTHSIAPSSRRGRPRRRRAQERSPGHRRPDRRRSARRTRRPPRPASPEPETPPTTPPEPEHSRGLSHPAGRPVPTVAPEQEMCLPRSHARADRPSDPEHHRRPPGNVRCLAYPLIHGHETRISDHTRPRLCLQPLPLPSCIVRKHRSFSARYLLRSPRPSCMQFPLFRMRPSRLIMTWTSLLYSPLLDCFLCM